MRRIVISAIVVLVVAVTLSAQTSPVQEVLVMQDRRDGVNMLLRITQDTYYLGEPAVSVPAEVAPGATLKASRFAVRGWREADSIRAVVYAVIPSPDAPGKTVETAIATYVLKDSPLVRVTETAAWGAMAIVLRPVRRLRQSRRGFAKGIIPRPIDFSPFLRV
jgi:hypothetical protein